MWHEVKNRRSQTVNETGDVSTIFRDEIIHHDEDFAVGITMLRLTLTELEHGVNYITAENLSTNPKPGDVVMYKIYPSIQHHGLFDGNVIYELEFAEHKIYDPSKDYGYT